MNKTDYKDTPYVGMATTKQVESHPGVPVPPEESTKEAMDDYNKKIRDLMHTAQTRYKLEWLMGTDTSEVEMIIAVCRRRLLHFKSMNVQLREIDQQIEKGGKVLGTITQHMKECGD